MAGVSEALLIAAMTFPGLNPVETKLILHVGLCASEDGKNWCRHSAPALVPIINGGAREHILKALRVLREGLIFEINKCMGSADGYQVRAPIFWEERVLRAAQQRIYAPKQSEAKQVKQYQSKKVLYLPHCFPPHVNSQQFLTESSAPFNLAEEEPLKAVPIIEQPRYDQMIRHPACILAFQYMQRVNPGYLGLTIGAATLIYENVTHTALDLELWGYVFDEYFARKSTLPNLAIMVRQFKERKERMNGLEQQRNTGTHGNARPIVGKRDYSY